MTWKNKNKITKPSNTRDLSITIKIRIHSSREIEDFVETHVCKLCVISDRAYYGLCVLIIKDTVYRSAAPLATTV